MQQFVVIWAQRSGKCAPQLLPPLFPGCYVCYMAVEWEGPICNLVLVYHVTRYWYPGCRIIEYWSVIICFLNCNDRCSVSIWCKETSLNVMTVNTSALTSCTLNKLMYKILQPLYLLDWNTVYLGRGDCVNFKVYQSCVRFYKLKKKNKIRCYINALSRKKMQRVTRKITVLYNNNMFQRDFYAPYVQLVTEWCT